MLIYTGNADGAKLEKVKELGLGIMIASSATRGPSKAYRDVPCALDNGAYQCWRRGFPFMPDVFMRTLASCYEQGLSLDFIVAPDIVAGGQLSLSTSLTWATNQLIGAPRLALAVQDGVEPTHNGVDLFIRQHFSHIFVGGTTEWKWKTAKDWVAFAHDHGMKCHIGRCGQLKYLEAAARYGADSVDSTSFARNDSWHIIEQFYGLGQLTFEEAPNAEQVVGDE